MRYMGGKQGIAKRIKEAIEPYATPDNVYWEPFLGGAGSFTEVAPMFRYAVGADLNKDITMLWDAVLTYGWEPPNELTKEQYKQIVGERLPSHIRGFVGFGCSFGGKWNGGFATGGFNSNGEPRNHVAESARNVLKTKEALKNTSVTILNGSYEDVLKGVQPEDVVYLDPPYRGVPGYRDSAGDNGLFDHEHFWAYAGALPCKVFVSEYEAPAGWKEVWTIPKRVTVKRGDQERHTAYEKLFTKD